MGALEFFQSEVKNLHQGLMEAVKDLTEEQLHFRPLDKGNHIAFNIWHYVRTEDTVLNFLLQKKKPVWNAEEWDKKLGLDPRSQGTGMTAEDAAAVRIKDMKLFLQYMENEFKATQDYLAGLKEEDLAPIHDLPALGKMSLTNLLGGTILRHGANHLGEIWCIKGIMGIKGSPV
jgi:hypothetical protein